ncbi:hypothetical protein PPL_01639 [Heterostelium album PN500]|uniref:HMA domain-containing protein n=1 Tax=Heterostelium pallidum (strain ATCC 26659 / Pp 5 / PN500) TaxID=670386 RepID=D3B025_HETP5|nr:hypothetical protein PPL_01639 [Heterostelium album PN500]EFA84649.1 hypothetical protein PPL_01639 [Heterostelium album PN500]|eukprot:XP_020436762.1 hypothetical protein PPL_01639 [Heterostelium album PN500]
MPTRVNTQIELAVEGRVYQFQAPTMDEAQEWLNHFVERASNKAKRQSTTISAAASNQMTSASTSTSTSSSSSTTPSNNTSPNLTSSSSSLFSSLLSSPAKQKQQTQQQQTQQQQDQDQQTNTIDNKDQTLIDIKGMMCQHCEDIVYRLMNSTKGVNECNVSVDEDRLVLRGNPNIDDVLHSLESHGFIVSISTQ